jgi:hypothetical protein
MRVWRRGWVVILVGEFVGAVDGVDERLKKWMEFESSMWQLIL